MIANHYGYGLRNDERPFAQKIPPGGNWRSLDPEDQRAFMKGALNSDGGQTTFLRRMTWDGPALTILAAPMAKATCQLHPGRREEAVVTENHVGGVPMREYPGHSASRLDEPAKTVVAGNHGVPGGLIASMRNERRR
ncbi:hypothetical protein [Paenibacillus motobuensis]|uniref:Uncharacterized protein n=1 Tax=Paenibacillus motobuensis TaxID=295324 RepID=A0ABN0XUE2_9BACL